MAQGSTSFRSTGPRLVSPTLLLVGGLVLLTASWIMANPPGAAPDEDAHYVKARASAHGHLLGMRFLPPSAPGDYKAAFAREVKRSFVMPSRGAADPRWGCNRVSGQSAACFNTPTPTTNPGREVLEITHVGPYQPAPYLPSGVAGRVTSALGGSPTAALYAGRAAAAAIGLAFLAAALAMAGDGWRLAATLVAVSPMVVFLTSALNTSGIEISAAIALAAAIVALRSRAPSAGLAWTVCGVSGAALALARPLGPAWVVMAAVAGVYLVGRRRIRTSFSSSMPVAGAAVATAALATLFAAVWDMAFMPRSSAPLSLARSLVGPAVATLPEVVHQTVGIFGWLDTRPPSWALAVGEAVAAIVLAGAVCLGTWKHRVVIVVGLLGFVVMVVGLNVFTQIPFEFFVQGRYVMPVSVFLLVVAGDGLQRVQGPRVPPAATAVSLVAVALHAVGWWTNARQSAVGVTGPAMFLGRSEWAPPLGWIAWIALAAIGVILMAAGVVGADRLNGSDATPTR